MEYFIYKSIDSREVKGLIVSSLPPITKPKMRTEIVTIDGRDGSIITDLGYEAYDKTVEIGLARGYNIDNIIAWLNGVGLIVFSNEPDKYYQAKIIDQIDYEKLLRFKTAKVTFNVQPFKYSTTDRVKTFDNLYSQDRITVINAGNYTSKPRMTFYGSGMVNVSLNGKEQFTLDMTDDGKITVDCAEQEAYSGLELKNRKMNGKFPLLRLGENVISWAGNLTKIEMFKFSRWI